ncbi:MAG: isoprenylcysteine carboxylmethyltransferase family protein [Spirochaetes bacterium]|nr:isoprenylcysteine carboxylmethyltransferase family protein [Spirochaetota bacterium]
MVRKSVISENEMRSLGGTVIFRIVFLVVLIGLFTLPPAGTFDFWQLYVYLLFMIIPLMTALVYFIVNDPRLLMRRMHTREKEKEQKAIQLTFTLFFLSAFVVSGLDRRFGWSDVPSAAVLAADFLGLMGYTLIFFVLKQNSYASRVVEVDKGQHVISDGLYGVIRHPMYAGVIIMWIPIPVALGSLPGLIPMASVPVLFILRILNEESVMKRELPGYEDYCVKTKYRLIPFVW